MRKTTLACIGVFSLVLAGLLGCGGAHAPGDRGQDQAPGDPGQEQVPGDPGGQPVSGAIPVDECAGAGDHPEWIFCDDFEDPGALQRASPPRWGRHNPGEGEDSQRTATEGRDGSGGFKVVWSQGEEFAGGLYGYFGRLPAGVLYPGYTAHRPDEKFTHVFVRFFVYHDPAFTGIPCKLSRVRVEAMAGAKPIEAYPAAINHVLGDSFATKPQMIVVSYTNVVQGGTALVAQAYNDDSAMRGASVSRPYAHLAEHMGTRRIAEEYAGRWHCIEYETQLNTPGNADGLSRLWIDGGLEVEVLQQSFVEQYSEYGINSVYLESYWNTGSPAPTPQVRVFDNLVVSTERVGCGTP